MADGRASGSYLLDDCQARTSRLIGGQILVSKMPQEARNGRHPRGRW